MSILELKKYHIDDAENVGSKFTLSNGYIGYRGTLDEASSSDFVALGLSGLYDGYREKEIVNAFNPLYSLVKADGIDLNPRSFRPIKHSMSLNTDTGLLKRSTDFQHCEIKISIKSERFLDQTDKFNLYSKFTLKASSPLVIELYSGIDDNIWNINEKHLKDIVSYTDGEMNILAGKTKGKEFPVVVGLIEEMDFEAQKEHIKHGIYRYTFALEPKKTYTIVKYASVLHSYDNGVELIKKNLQKSKSIGYKQLFKNNQEFWKDIFEKSRVHVFNNPQVMSQIDYAIFQMVSHRPYSDLVSINKKGLSGQFDLGTVSWETEIMLLPFFINTMPEVARHMVMYRINSLEQAKRKAEMFGYEGAFYAEKSGLLGEELSADVIKNNIHINGSIIYGIFQYVERTRDFSVLFDGGLHSILETARFYKSYATLSKNKKHYDFLQVKGLDDSHGFVDNEAYTNYIIKNTLDVTIKLVAYAKTEEKILVRNIFKEYGYDKLVSELRELRRKLYTKKEQIDYEIEAHDRYHNLDNRSVSDLKRIEFLNKYPVKEVENTTFIHNANVISKLALFMDDFSEKVRRVNYDYYLRRSVNPDVFTRINYVIVGCASNETDEAYKQYLEIANLKVTNDFLFNEGLNMILIGGIYNMIVYGFAGVRHHGYLLSGDYNQAQKIRRLEFNMQIANNLAYIKTKRNSVTISWNEE